MICLIIPVLNEAQHIRPLVERIAASMSPNKSWVICWVDDGSTDGTIAEIDAISQKYAHQIHLIRRHKTIPGCQRGSALHVALSWAVDSGKFLFFVEMDGDLSHLPEEIHLGLHALQQADVVIASKYLAESKVVSRSKGRVLLSWITTRIMRIALGIALSDYSNGFRFYNLRAAKILRTHQPHNGSPIYLSEALAVWQSNGMEITEIPSTYIGRQEGSSKVQIVDLLKGFKAVFEIGMLYRLGRYRIEEGGE